MAEHTVGEGGDFKTLTAALKAAKSGDVLVVLPGVYREFLKIDVPNLTIIGQPGAALDGGYSREWAKLVTAKKPGTRWDNLQYKAPPAKSRDMILVAANGVTVEGLRIVNAPSSGVAAGAVSNLIVRGCEFDHIYGTAIKVNGTRSTAQHILIVGNRINAASVRIFDPTRQYSDPQGVSGSIKCGNAAHVVIRGNRVTNGFGEGINLDKNLTNFVTERNFVADCNHKYFYCNSAVDGIVRDNVAVCTGHPAHLWTRGRAPAGFAVNDETARKPFSDNIVWENNISVNMGIPIQIQPRADGRMTVRNNTFIWGPLTRNGPQVKGGRVEFTGNIFAVTSGGPPPTGNVTAGPGLWTARPPKGWQHADDVIGDPMFDAPSIPDGPHDAYGLVDNVEFTPDGYMLRPGSPAVRGGVVKFGALGVAGGDPPVEPPIEPPVDPDPPVDPPPDPEPEPPADPLPALKEARAKLGEVLEEARAEHERALASVKSLERQIAGLEMALMGLDMLITLFENEE